MTTSLRLRPLRLSWLALPVLVPLIWVSGCSKSNFDLIMPGDAGVGDQSPGMNTGGGGGGKDSGAPSPPDLTIPGDMAIDRSGQIINPAGLCVEVSTSAALTFGTPVQLGVCTGAANQKWTFEADGTIRGLQGYCIDDDHSGITDGTKVQMWGCDGTAAQEWIETPSHNIVSPLSNKCLDSNGTGTGVQMQILTCGGSANQTWTPPVHGVGNGRVVVYYQTQYNGSTYVSPLPLTTNSTRVSDVVVGAFHLQSDLTVHLNNDPPNAAKFTQMWKDVAALQAQGVRVEAMIGGAAKGSFAGLDTNFYAYYPLLKSIIDTYHVDGVDLDVEETMSLAGIEKVVATLRSDYGNHFVITFAPVAAELHASGNLAGFDYEQLYRDAGTTISWFNVQFYNGWGSFANTADFDTIVARALIPTQKLVAGVLSNSANGSSGFVPITNQQSTIKSLLGEHPELGGVASWEYFNSLPGDQAAPWQWASTIATALGR